MSHFAISWILHNCRNFKLSDYVMNRLGNLNPLRNTHTIEKLLVTWFPIVVCMLYPTKYFRLCAEQLPLIPTKNKIAHLTTKLFHVLRDIRLIATKSLGFSIGGFKSIIMFWHSGFEIHLLGYCTDLCKRHVSKKKLKHNTFRKSMSEFMLWLCYIWRPFPLTYIYYSAGFAWYILNAIYTKNKENKLSI